MCACLLKYCVFTCICAGVSEPLSLCTLTSPLYSSHQVINTSLPFWCASTGSFLQALGSWAWVSSTTRQGGGDESVREGRREAIMGGVGVKRYGFGIKAQEGRSNAMVCQSSPFTSGQVNVGSVARSVVPRLPTSYCFRCGYLYIIHYLP
jgi:hypothetical protein